MQTVKEGESMEESLAVMEWLVTLATTDPSFQAEIVVMEKHCAGGCKVIS